MRVLSEAPLETTDTTAIYVRRYEMRRGERFGFHTHPEHQLSWSPSGVLSAVAGDDCWMLPPTLGVWIPADVPHDVVCSRDAGLYNVYLHPDRCPIRWTEPTVVTVSGLLRELVAHLGDPRLSQPERSRAEVVLFDLVQPLPVAPITLVLPVDPRAREVAVALLDDPTDDRTLNDWGRHVGASYRTLARRFTAETGCTFADWRSQARLRAALVLLAAGTPTTVVASRVGYRHASAFVAAFRRIVGLTPGAYYASLTAGAEGPPDRLRRPEIPEPEPG